MKKLLLFAALLVALPQIKAQMIMPPNKKVTKAIKKNPAILNAISANPNLLNSLNLNDDLVDAVTDNPQILTVVSANPALLNTINANPDFLKTLVKKPEVLIAINMNPHIITTLNSNPELIKSINKKPALINTVAMNMPVASNSDNNNTNNNTGQTAQNALLTTSTTVEEKKDKSTGSKILLGALGVATGLPLNGGKGALFTRKITTSGDIQKNLDKSKNKNIFLAKRYDEYVTEHKVVAILPFSVDIEGENKKQITSKKERVRNEKEIEEQIQESLYKFLLSNQDKYSIEFQDINNTNLKLKNAGIMSTLYTTPKEEIAKALGVDAVIAGNYVQKMNNKESKSGIIKITLYDGQTGEWVWKLDENAGSKYSLIDETDKLMNSLMGKVVNFFPYRTSN